MSGRRDFPQGYFFISNVESSNVLDVSGNSTQPDAEVIIWGRKTEGCDNQLWEYDNGYLINKNSGLVLEIPGYESGGQIKPGTRLTQAKRRDQPESLNQLWAYKNQWLYAYDPKVWVTGEGGNVTKPGTNAVVDISDPESEAQKWNCIKA